MNKHELAKINTWNKLRFGNRAPKAIRKHLTKMLREPITKYGFGFMSDGSCYHGIIVPASRTNWYVHDKKDDTAVMRFKYVPKIESFFVVNDDDYDFELHIGWEGDSPFIMIINNHNRNDSLLLVPNDGLSAKQIAEHWRNILVDLVIDEFIYSRRKTKWLTKIEQLFS